MVHNILYCSFFICCPIFVLQIVLSVNYFIKFMYFLQFRECLSFIFTPSERIISKSEKMPGLDKLARKKPLVNYKYRPAVAETTLDSLCTRLNCELQQHHKSWFITCNSLPTLKLEIIALLWKTIPPRSHNCLLTALLFIFKT